MRCTFMATAPDDSPVMSAIAAGVHVFEMRHDHLAVERVEAPDQPQQALARAASSRAPRPGPSARRVGEAVGFFERGELEPAQAHPAGDVRGRRVVRHPVDPGALRTAPVVTGKRPPEREMDVLQQVAAGVGVGLVGVRQALEPVAERAGRFPIEVVLAGPRCPASYAGSRWRRDYLTARGRLRRYWTYGTGERSTRNGPRRRRGLAGGRRALSLAAAMGFACSPAAAAQERRLCRTCRPSSHGAHPPPDRQRAPAVVHLRRDAAADEARRVGPCLAANR